MRLKKNILEEAEEESDNEFDDNPESTPQQSTSQPRSTSQPLPKKQKVESKKIKRRVFVRPSCFGFSGKKKSARWR